MKLLLLDIGNTNSKIKCFDTLTKIYCYEQTILTNEFLNSFSKLSLWLLTLNFDKIIYSSVNQTASSLIEQWIKDQKIRFVNIANCLDQNDFVMKTTGLGHDLIAYYYAVKQYQKNTIVIALGTATTINLIVDQQYQGVIIAPGLKIALDSLFIHADLLDQTKYDEIQTTAIVGTTTNAAIWLGAIKGHFAMLIQTIDELTNKYSIDSIIVTGGNLKYLNKLIKTTNWEIDSDLLFKGLINLATNN